LPELKKKLEQSGFRVEFANYANMLLFPLVVLKRFSENFITPQKNSDISIDAGCLGNLFKRCLVFESRLITKCRFPFGVSIFALARKVTRGGFVNS